MKSAEEIMEILKGFDLTASYRDAAELAGCSPNTVARYVACREAGTLMPGRAERRPSVIDGFLPKLEELVERSQGKIRADVAHDKIVAMGFAGSERTTRRAVAEIKKAWRSGRRRVHRPVRSARGALPVFPPVGFPEPPPAPAVPVSGQRALHKSRCGSWSAQRCSLA